MIDYDQLFARFDALGRGGQVDGLKQALHDYFNHCRNGHWPQWRALLTALPEAERYTDASGDLIELGSDTDDLDALREQLQALSPWRKGPFDVCGIHIDAEWRSELKYNRIAPHLPALRGRQVLDVGSGNGYYAWRMAGEGADLVLGIDPSLRFVVQWAALKHFAEDEAAWVMPFTLETLPEAVAAFDTVLSMGVLYHRRNPIEHLDQLRARLRPGGTLVLETLVIEGDERAVLVPEDRYAMMRNVWFLPSVAALKRWLERCGFENVRCVDETPTTVDEQRATEWIGGHSLENFLDPEDASKTAEGYEAPLRATLLAEAP